MVRFRWYSFHLRTILYHCVGFPSHTTSRFLVATDRNLLKELDIHCPVNLIFPNVRRLVCKAENPEEALLWLFVGPRLRSIVQFFMTTTLSGMERILEAIIDRCPLFEAINLGSLNYENMVHLQPLMFRFLTTCVNLRTLEIPTFPLNPSIVRSIASLPNLEVLCWDGDEINFLDPRSNYFPRILRYIQLEPADFTTYFSLARSITSKRLERFDIQCRAAHSNELHQLLSILHERSDHAYLMHIGIRQMFGQLNESCIADINSIEPLLSFHNLRTLILMEVCVLNFYDQDMATMASNWPLLEKMVFNIAGGHRGWTHPYTITPRGFFALIRGCPELVQLLIHLTFEAEDLEDQIQEMENVRGCPKLHSLSVGDAKISHPEPVAALFCRLFPSLPKVVYSSPTRGGWEVVSLALRQQHLRPGWS